MLTATSLLTNPIFKNFWINIPIFPHLTFVKHHRALSPVGSDTKPTAGNQASVQGFEIWQPAFNNVRRSNTREAVPASTPLPAWGRVSGADSGTGASSKCPFERSSSSPRASLGQGSYFSGSHGDSQPHLNGSLRKKDKSLSQSNVTDFLPKSRSSPVGLKTQSLCGFSGTPMASCRPMLPTVTPPEKKIHGSQERI